MLWQPCLFLKDFRPKKYKFWSGIREEKKKRLRMKNFYYHFNNRRLKNRDKRVKYNFTSRERENFSKNEKIKISEINSHICVSGGDPSRRGRTRGGDGPAPCGRTGGGPESPRSAATRPTTSRQVSAPIPGREIPTRRASRLPSPGGREGTVVGTSRGSCHNTHILS